MKTRFIARMVFTLACLLAGPPGFAQTYWFTVLGDPLDVRADTVEVDPRPISVNAHLRTLRVRVSRAAPRESREGVPYRSFESQVVFDCGNLTARYTVITYYMLPAWQGPSHKTSIFPESPPRWMEFRSVQPNPTARIIRAACPQR